MIRLVATDIDGTLVKDSSPSVSDEVIKKVQQLSDSGIHVVIASGRQYASLRKLFARADRNLTYIAENGAHIVMNGENYSLKLMDRKSVEEIMADLRTTYYEGCRLVASTPTGCFLENCDPAFLDLMENGYHNDVALTDDLLAEKADFMKLAIYRKGTIREIGETFLVPKWKDRVKCCLAGEEWVDFMHPESDKGNAMRRVLEALGVGRDEAMVFGDNENDIGMLQAVEESYCVSNAREKVRAAAKHICPPYWENGVLKVLNEMF